MKKLILVAIICLLVGLPQFADNSKRPLTPQDILDLTAIGDPQVSPDGNTVAFMTFIPKKEKKYPTMAIWIAGTDGKSKARKFVFSSGSETAPRWSPDGKYLAFLAKRGDDKTRQIYLLPLGGGEALPVTKVTTVIYNFKWFKDSKKIAFLAKDTASEEEKKKMEKNDAVIIDENPKYVRLYELDLKTQKVRLVTKEDENINDFSYSPTGKQFAILVSTNYIDETYYRSKLVVINNDGSGKKIIAQHARTMVAWSPVGNEILAFAPVGKYGKTNLPALYTLDGAKPRVLFRDSPIYVNQAEWLPNGKVIVFGGYQGTAGIIGTMNTKTQKISIVCDTGSRFPQYTVDSKGGKVIYLGAGPSAPEDIWIITLKGEKKKQLTHMNPQVKDLLFGAVEVVKWQSKDGLTIEGVLVKPVGYKPGKKYPLVLQIHGGPEWVWTHGFIAHSHEWAQMLANNGYAVLLPNIRGSQGYGVEFIEKNYTDIGGGDFQDILDGIDHLVKSGIADPDRVGISGWSYGGFMTSWAVTQSDIFKAAVDGAGSVNFETQYRLSDNDIMWDYYFQGNPYNKKEEYTAHSPITHIKNVTAPILILHGKEDKRVPVSQAYEFYSALKKMGVKTRLVLYPRAGHGIGERVHQLDMMTQILDWFDSHL